MAKLQQRYTGLENLKGRAESAYFGAVFDEANGASFSDDHAVKSSIQNVEILLDSITPRSVNRYSQTRIDRLAKSIRDTNNRLINPIVVVRASDLDPDGEVIRKFRERGIDVSSLEYVLVAGERRYRAFLKLRAEEDEKEHDNLWKNPFVTITARILTPEEAKKEEVYYDESNTQARQLTPEEALRHFEDAVKTVNTEEQKYALMKEMEKAGVKFSQPIPEDIKAAVKMFRMPAFCVYWMEKELGITGWGTESSAKAYLSVLNNCCDEVKEAIFDTVFSFRQAREITGFDYDEQRTLLDLWKSGDIDGYKAKIAALDAKGGKPAARRVTNKSTAKDIDRLVAQVRKDTVILEEDRKNLNGKSLKITKEAIKTVEDFMKKMAEYSASLRE